MQSSQLRRLSSRLFALSTLAGLVAFGCGKKEGGEGEDCYANGTCDGELTCLSNICVDPNASGTSGQSSSTGSSGDSGGLDFDECFACGDKACDSERSACDDANGCDDLLDCILGCGSDASCQSGCSVDGLAAQELADAGLAASGYVTCAVTSCLDECTPDVGGSSSSGGDGDNGGSGVDLDGCFGCGESTCSSAYSACEGQTGCIDLWKCGWECSGSTDASCATNCSASLDAAEAADAALAVADLVSCQATECLDACAYGADTTGGDSGDSGDSGGTSAGETTSGSDSTGGDSGGSVDLPAGYLFDGDGVAIDVPELGAIGYFFILEDSVDDSGPVLDGLEHTDLDPPGSSSEPSNLEGESAPCVSGTVARVSSATGASCQTSTASCDWAAFWGGGIGLMMNDDSETVAAWDGSAHSGIIFGTSGYVGLPLRFMVEDTSGEQFCTEIDVGEVAIRWTDLRHECWDPTSKKLDPSKIKQISWMFVPDASYPYSVSDFCVERVAVMD